MFGVAETELRARPNYNGGRQDRPPSGAPRQQQGDRREHQEDDVHRQDIEQRGLVHQQQRIDEALERIRQIEGQQILHRRLVDAQAHRRDDGEEKEIRVLAICNYDDKEECYLFACDDQFNVLGDTLHDSLEDAMKAAIQLYEQEEIKWL